MHSETKVCLSSLLLWKTSPEEPGLTPKCFPSLLAGLSLVHSYAGLTAHYIIVYYDSQADLYDK